MVLVVKLRTLQLKPNHGLVSTLPAPRISVEATIKTQHYPTSPLLDESLSPLDKDPTHYNRGPFYFPHICPSQNQDISSIPIMTMYILSIWFTK
jgi:hypothetical protein